MEYTIDMSHQASQFMRKAETELYARLRKAMDKLVQNPRPHDCEKMKNGEGYRIRVGNYRIVYDIEDDVLVIFIIRIDRRDQVYKKR